MERVCSQPKFADDCTEVLKLFNRDDEFLKKLFVEELRFMDTKLKQTIALLEK
jgi:hypothetical protein